MTRSALPDLKLSFQKFCDDWIGKLRVREADNLARMHWETASDGVRGSYVGYAQEYTCTLGEGDDPVGTVRYREFRYEKHGSTVAEAEGNSPLPIEAYDTREYFSYIRGKWDY